MVVISLKAPFRAVSLERPWEFAAAPMGAHRLKRLPCVVAAQQLRGHGDCSFNYHGLSSQRASCLYKYAVPSIEVRNNSKGGFRAFLFVFYDILFLTVNQGYDMIKIPL